MRAVPQIAGRGVHIAQMLRFPIRPDAMDERGRRRKNEVKAGKIPRLDGFWKLREKEVVVLGWEIGKLGKREMGSMNPFLWKPLAEFFSS